MRKFIICFDFDIIQNSYLCIPRFEDFDIEQFVDYLQDNVEPASSQQGNGPVQNCANNDQKQPSPQSNSFFYKCTVCREIVGSSQELLRHVRTHTRPMRFSNGANNRRVSHMRHILISFEKRKKKKRIPIPTLNQQNITKNVHSGNLNCCICLRSFNDPDELKRHEETQHSSPYTCRFCNSMFGVLKLYKIHQNLHIQQQQKQNSRVPDRQQYNKQLKKSGLHVYSAPTTSFGNACRPSVQNYNQGLFTSPQQHNNQTFTSPKMLSKCVQKPSGMFI